MATAINLLHITTLRQILFAVDVIWHRILLNTAFRNVELVVGCSFKLQPTSEPVTDTNSRNNASISFPPAGADPVRTGDFSLHGTSYTASSSSSAAAFLTFDSQLHITENSPGRPGTGALRPTIKISFFPELLLNVMWTKPAVASSAVGHWSTTLCYRGCNVIM